MGTPISQFNPATLLLNTDLLAGLRGTGASANDYKFPVIGIGDSLGSPIITWTQGAGTAGNPNINQINFQNNISGSAPIISVISTGLTPDTNVNLNIGALGTGHVEFTGTGAIGVPSGTTAQQPTGFLGGFRYNTDTGFLEYWDALASMWVDIINGAALATLTYVTNTDETADLPNSQPLSLLATGIMKVTTGTGIISSLAIPLVVADGGTGDSTFTAYSVLCAGTTATGAFQNVSGLGTSGYVLTSNGAGALPTWQANAGSTAIQTIDGDSGSMSGTTVTISGGSTGLTTSAAAATMNLTGTLILANGGTSASLTASNGGIFYSTASAGAILAGTATAHQMLQSGASTAPAWSTATWPATTAINQLLYSSSANTVVGLATAASAVLTTVASVPTWSSDLSVGLGGTGNSTFTAYSVICAGTTATGAFQNVSGLGTSGYVLTSNGAGSLPTWQAAAATGVVTIDGDSGSATGSTITITGTGIGLSTSATGSTLTIGGTLKLANGGTGASLTASNGGIFYSTASAGAILSGTATANQLLMSGASTTPAWSTSTYPTTNAINTLLYASAANTMSALATANNSILATNGSGVPALTTSMPTAVQIGVANINSGTGASASTYYRGDNTWAASSGAGALVPLATLTASSSASLAFTSLFSSSYYQYLIVFTNILPATDNTKLYLVVGTGGTPTYVSTGYLWQLQGGYAAGNNQSGAGNSNDAQAVLAFLDGSGVSNSATYNGVSGFMYISAIGGSSQTMTGVGHLGYETTSEGWCIQQNSFNLPAASYTALKFLFSAGNIASGTIDIYGLAAG